MFIFKGDSTDMKICVIGLGYIGFPTACLMARAGHQVVGVDVNEAVVKGLQNGELHIVGEEGLADVARGVLASGALTVSTSPAEADAFIVCVPTPVKVPEKTAVADELTADDVAVTLSQVAAASETTSGAVLPNSLEAYRPKADLSYVEAAVHAIGPVVRPGNLVIVESPVPPGTTEQVVLPILEGYGLNRDQVLLAHVPERVIPGAVMLEMVANDRVVGGLTPEAAEAAKKLYATIVKGQIFATDATTAEFVKLIENTYRDVNIALANEMARVAEYLGIDIQQSIALANRHPRVNILNPGPGVGGHCIPVDPQFLIDRAPDLTPLIQAARAVNDGMIDHVVNLVDQLSKEEGLHRWVILGVAYKADVGDERNSPALDIADRLVNRGLTVAMHDPFIEQFNRPLDELVLEAEGLLLVTDHSMYLNLDPESLGRHMRRRVLVDTRLRIDADKWEMHGFLVRRLGDGRRARPLMR